MKEKKKYRRGWGEGRTLVPGGGYGMKGERLCRKMKDEGKWSNGCCKTGDEVT